MSPLFHIFPVQISKPVKQGRCDSCADRFETEGYKPTKLTIGMVLMTETTEIIEMAAMTEMV